LSGTNTKSGVGLETGKYKIYGSAVLDGYQKYFPEQIYPFSTGDLLVEVSADGYISIQIRITASDEEKYKRIKAIDLFIRKVPDNLLINPDLYPAYFCGRIDMNDPSDYFLEIEGTLDNTPGAKCIGLAYFPIG